MNTRSGLSVTSSWTALAALALVAGCGSPTDGGPARAANDKELADFLNSYFATWSEGNMKAYSAHFHERAVIAPMRDALVAPWVARDRFVSQQTQIRQRAGGRSVERMLSFEADTDEYAATVVAQWELTKGSGVDVQKTRGVDRFTLIRDREGSWKIVSLLFYSTD